ncbi:MAG: choice-of-anchor D domain-containing protein [Planctomycetes bacterium]|nr:choice-of-anchor D domain-containing protein [Planctomycetota bacterium]
MIRTTICFLALCLFTSVIAAQSYTMSSGYLSGSYTDLSAPTTINVAPGNISAAISPPGFNFSYFGATYTSFKIGAGGYVVMGSGGTVISTTPQHAAAPGLVISPLWTNLSPGNRLMPTFSATYPQPGRVSYNFVGGVLGVEWWNVPVGGDSPIGVRMKVLLDTSTGAIHFNYGDVPVNCTGATTTFANACAISGPSNASPQEVIPGALGNFTPYINSNGSVDIYPVNGYVTFAPPAVPLNTPPGITAEYDASFGGPPNMLPIGNGGTVNVSYGQSVSGADFGIFVNDLDSTLCSLTASITNIGTTGIVLSEWQSASLPVPLSLTPLTGAFNTVAGVTHLVTLTANDGMDSTIFTFNIVQAPQPATPSISVSDGANITPGQAAAGTARAFGDMVVGTGPGAALTITIANNGGAALILSGFAVTGDSGEFLVDTSSMSASVASAGSTTFTIAFSPTSTGAKSATVSFNHDDPGVANPFTFEITGNGTTSTPGPGPTPISGGGGGGGGGCVAGSGANFALLLVTAMSACLGARTLRRRVSR